VQPLVIRSSSTSSRKVCKHNDLTLLEIHQMTARAVDQGSETYDESWYGTASSERNTND
jgi:hypothetical protein